MSELVVFRGPSATGKSTYAAQHYHNHVRLNMDTIRADHPDWSEKQVLAHVRRGMEDARKSGLSIVHDNVNFPQSKIVNLKDWSDVVGYDFTVVEFGKDVTLTEAIARDRMRGENGGHTVGKSVIMRQYMDFGYYVPEMPNDAIMFDIDGTLANIDHRLNFVSGDSKNWGAFFAEMHKDTVNAPVATAAYVYKRVGFKLIVMSGRPENYRAITEQWLDSCGIPYDFLVMRPFNDMRPDHIVKEELYRKYVEPYFAVSSVYDDRQSVVDMWRRIGLTCFQVAERDF